MTEHSALADFHLERIRGHRIELMLPVNSAHERQVVRDAVERLRERYGGATHSSLASRGGFGGEYGDEEATRDQVAYVFADTVSRRESYEAVEQFLGELLEWLDLRYREEGASQRAVMGTIHNVDVLVGTREGDDH